MITSPNGIALIKEFEGLELKAYRDSVGVLTIGYGTTNGVFEGQVIDQSKAEKFLAEDLYRFETCVSKLVKVAIAQNQFDALVCFAYNVGCSNLASSTLLKKLNTGDYVGAAEQFPRWNKAGGKVLNGLTRRREAEKALFSRN